MSFAPTVSVSIENGPPKVAYRKKDKEKIKNRALQIKMRESLRHALCIRIQKNFRKSPEVAKQLSSVILCQLLKDGDNCNPSDEELKCLMKEFESTMVVKKQTTRRESSPKINASSHMSQSRSSPKDNSRSKRTVPSRDANQKARNGLDHSTYMTEAQLQQASVGFNMPPNVSPIKNKKPDIWKDLVDYSKLEEEEENKTKAVTRINQRQQWVRELEGQLNEKNEKKYKEHEADQRYYNESMKKLEAMNLEEKKKELRKFEAAKKQNMDQAEQRRYKEELKRREMEIKRMEETKMVEMIRKQQEEDMERERQRKLDEKKKMERVIQENAISLKRKEEQKNKEREYEVKLAEEYIQMEERKDRDRRRALEEMSMKIQAKMKHFDDNAKAEMDEKNRAEELRCLKYQQDFEQKEREDERRRKDQVKMRNYLQQEELKRQVKEKHDREAKERREMNQQADLWKQEVRMSKMKDAQESQQRTMRNRMQQQWLKDQMDEKQRQMTEADHSALEIQINKSIISKLSKKMKPRATIDAKAMSAKGNLVAQQTHRRSKEIQDQERGH